jgi:hypothetical protein
VYQARAFWLQLDEKAKATRVWTALLPGGEPEAVAAPPDVVELTVAPGALALVRAGGGVSVLDPETRAVVATAP